MNMNPDFSLVPLNSDYLLEERLNQVLRNLLIYNVVN